MAPSALARRLVIDGYRLTYWLGTLGNILSVLICHPLFQPGSIGPRHKTVDPIPTVDALQFQMLAPVDDSASCYREMECRQL